MGPFFNGGSIPQKQPIYVRVNQSKHPVDNERNKKKQVG